MTPDYTLTDERRNPLWETHLVRRCRLHCYLRQRDMAAADLARRIARSPSHVSDLLNGRKSFGERAARHIEQSLALPSGYLDSRH